MFKEISCVEISFPQDIKERTILLVTLKMDQIHHHDLAYLNLPLRVCHIFFFSQNLRGPDQ